jgi:hypothetical protein
VPRWAVEVVVSWAGELECSAGETDRLRAALGLRPLRPRAAGAAGAGGGAGGAGGADQGGPDQGDAGAGAGSGAGAGAAAAGSGVATAASPLLELERARPQLRLPAPPRRAGDGGFRLRTTVDSGGVVQCSVAESNRLRAFLGLPQLHQRRTRNQ